MLTPLPTDEQTRAMRYVHHCRKDWDAAGIRDALNELSPLVADSAELLIVMLEWARSKDSRLPAGVIGYAKNRPAPEAVVRTITPPVNDPTAGIGSEWCDVHGCRTTLRNDGERVCCWQDRMLDNPPPVRPLAGVSLRTVGPITAEAKALIESTLGPRRRAREVTEAKEQ